MRVQTVRVHGQPDQLVIKFCVKHESLDQLFVAIISQQNYFYTRDASKNIRNLETAI